MSIKIGVLALQGAFIEHEQMLNHLGVQCVELRQKKDLDTDYQGLILPGGESTVQTKLLKELDMYDTIKAQIESGMPVLGTCAGMILLVDTFKTFPGEVKRNAYGRQLGSFNVNAEVKGIGNIPMTFIRAPYMTAAGEGVNILSVVDDKIVAAQYGNQVALAFHPEVTGDESVHKYYLELVNEFCNS